MARKEGQGVPASQSGIPKAGELVTAGLALMGRTTGVMRGIFPSDADDKLVSMKVGELRRIERFVCMATLYASANNPPSTEA